MSWMTIGQVARKMGLQSSAIRYYERTGLLPKPPRFRGQRRYDHRALERLAIVRFAKHVGFTVREIRWLLDGAPERPPPDRWKAMAAAKVKQLEAWISRAQTMRDAILRTLGHRCPHLAERGKRLVQSASKSGSDASDTTPSSQ